MKREERKKTANKKLLPDPCPLIPRICFLIVFFAAVTCFVFSRGAADEEAIKTQNDEWILLITNFDSDSLPEERKPVSDLVMRKLVENITAINHRVRISEEYAYYEEYAFAQTRQTAAKALEAKLNERSLLIFKGEPDRTYKINLARLDNEIKVLQEKLEEAENTIPVINAEPVFKLKENNLTYQFPAPPKPGNEYRFSSNEKADAIITGSVTDFHGRFIVSIKLYTVYTRSFVWEDRIIFSHEDMNDAMEEITRRLLINLSGSKPAAVAITTQPENALVLINRSFADFGLDSDTEGAGDAPVLEYPPGTYQITASAPEHESISFSTQLLSGELQNIFINLRKIEFGNLEILGADNGSMASVYHGAMYIGDSPLTFRLPLGQMEFLELKAEDERIGRIVFQMPDSNTVFEDDLPPSISVRTKRPVREGSVDLTRRLFYWSWGVTWLTGVTAFLSNHAFNNIVYAFTQTGNTSVKLYEDAIRMNYVRSAAVIGLGVIAAIDVLLITRYIYVSNKGSASIRKSN